MIKRLILSIASLAVAAASMANIPGDWRLSTAFDNYPYQIIDTPNKVYMLGLGQDQRPNYGDLAKAYPFLFMYDKQTEEMTAMTKRNYLQDNLIQRIGYNPYKNYLLVIYDNSDIDMIFDDGNVINVPYLAQASITGSKKVNDIVFDYEKDLVYLATDFGFLTLNSVDGSVKDSRIFGSKIISAGRVGDGFVLFTETEGRYTDNLAHALALDNFSVIEGMTTPRSLMPLYDGRFLYLKSNGAGCMAYPTETPGKFTFSPELLYNFTLATPYRDGYVLGGNTGYILLVQMDAQYKTFDQLPREGNSIFSTWDGKELWRFTGRKGLSSYKINDRTSFTLTRGDIMPNVSTVFGARDMAYSPQNGVVAINHSVLPPYHSYSNSPNDANLSAYKQGEWKAIGPQYTGSPYAGYLMNPNGIVVDPDNPDIYYWGSYFQGLTRYDSKNPQNTFALVHKNSSLASIPNTKALLYCNGWWTAYCNISNPELDAQGNLWFLYDSDPNQYNPRLYCWPAADRKVGNIDINILKAIRLHTNVVPTRLPRIISLKATPNTVFIIDCMAGRQTEIINHNGTPENTNDDKYVVFSQYVDADGYKINSYIYCAVEDPNTGYIWVGHESGVFYINPATAFTNPNRVNRVKVARNDGTNLADYLLDQIPVTGMAVDDKGRLWFTTMGAGVVCTSADGREILAQFTEDNSYLPSNNVTGAVFNPENGSMVFSTMAGMAEFFPGASNGSHEAAEEGRLNIYPNPVRPEYMGWVTIENLPDNAIVKIVDSSGNLVRELGQAQNGTVKWDVTSSEYNRVRSGVYYVLATSGPGETQAAAKGKILVIR